MQETKRMADEANRMGQQVQEGFQTGLEAASRSFTEANRSFRALASEMTDFSKRRFEDVSVLGSNSFVRGLSQT